MKAYSLVKMEANSKEASDGCPFGSQGALMANGLQPESGQARSSRELSQREGEMIDQQGSKQ